MPAGISGGRSASNCCVVFPDSRLFPNASSARFVTLVVCAVKGCQISPQIGGIRQGWDHPERPRPQAHAVDARHDLAGRHAVAVRGEGGQADLRRHGDGHAERTGVGPLELIGRRARHVRRPDRKHRSARRRADHGHRRRPERGGRRPVDHRGQRAVRLDGHRRRARNFRWILDDGRRLNGIGVVARREQQHARDQCHDAASGEWGSEQACAGW